MGKVTAFSCISKYNITENSLKVHKYFHREILFSFHRMFAVTQNIQKMCVSQIEKSETPSSLLKNVASIESQFLTKVTSEKKNTLFCFKINKSWRNSRKLGNSLSWPFLLQFWRLEPDHQVWRNASSTRPRRTYPTFRPRKGHSGMSTINIKATPPSSSSTCANENLINILFLFISRIPHLIKSSIIS